MSHASSQMQEFARRLVNSEVNGSNSERAKTSDAFGLCEKLRPQLATLMGNGGFRALLARALVLASAEVSWLRGLNVKPDGTLGGLDGLPPELDPDSRFEGGVVLLAQLLGLLVAFIGETLTLRLVREIWPKASFDDLNLDKKGKNEKTK
jgi:hypothetical protein